MSSRKMLIAIVVMVLLLAVAAGGYFLVDRTKQQAEDAQQAELDALQLFDFNADNIDTVTFDMAEGSFRIEAQDNSWVLAETDYPYGLTLNSYYINSVASYMADLTALQKFDIEPDQLAAYGFDEPTIVNCYLGNTAYTLYIGDASVTEEYWYVMLPDDDTVYGIDYNEGAVLCGGIQYLRTRYILPFYEVNITALTLEKEQEVYIDMAIQDGQWHMDAPLKDANVDSAQVKSLLTTLTRIEADSFVTVAENKADLAEYALDQPDYTLTVICSDEVYTLDFSVNPQDSSSMYVLQRESGEISSLSTSSAGFLQMQPEEFLEDKLLNVPFAEAESLEVQVDDIAFTMTMHADTGEYLFNDTLISLTDSNLSGLFRNLYDTVANLSYEALDLTAEIPEDAEEACKFRFVMTDGTETILTLIQTRDDENLYYAVLNGDYTGATVRRRALTGSTGVLNFYEKFTDALEET